MSLIGDYIAQTSVLSVLVERFLPATLIETLTQLTKFILLVFYI